MESLFESLVALQNRLRDAGISSAVIGGVAVGVWGEPRVTRDVDVKVLLGRGEAAALLGILAPGYQPFQSDPLEALTRHGILFVQDALGTRLDLLLSDTEFDVQAIRRARLIEVWPGLTVRVCTAEDLIIYKLVSTRLRDHEDAAGIARRQAESLDDAYVLQWLQQFERALDDSTLIAEYRRLRAGRRG